MATKLVTSIDIGLSSVKVAQFEIVDDGFKVVDFGLASYPRDQAGMATDETIIDSIHKLLDEKKLRPKTVFLSIPRSQITSKRLSNFPANATEDQIADVVAIQAETELPFGSGQVVYDYQILQHDASQVLVELVGSRQNVVNRYLRLVSSLDVVVAGVVPSTDALGYLARQTISDGDNETESSDRHGPILVADIGAGHTDLLLIRGKRVMFSRSFPTAGDRLTQMFASVNNLTFEAAEHHKQEHATLIEGTESTEVTTQWAANLVQEIQLSIQAAARGTIGEVSSQPNAIWLCGGSSLIPGLSQFVENELNQTPEERLHVRLWNPLDGLVESNVVEPTVTYRMSLAIGLGSLAISEELPFNLLPVEVKEQRTREKQQKRVLFYAAAALVLLLAMVWAVSSWVSSKVDERMQIEDELARMQPRYTIVEKQIKLDLVMVDMLMPRISPLDVLQELSDKLPSRKNIALKSFNLGNVDQAGKGTLVMQLEANSHADISQAMNTLKNSPLFKSVKSGQVTNTEKNKRPIFQTQLSCVLADNANTWIAKRRRLAAQEELQVAALPPVAQDTMDAPEEEGEDFMPMMDDGFAPLLLDEEPEDTDMDADAPSEIEEELEGEDLSQDMAISKSSESPIAADGDGGNEPVEVESNSTNVITIEDDGVSGIEVEKGK